MNDADLEQPIDGTPPDETDINLRAYFSRMSDQRLREYDAQWSDEQVIEWDGNFRADGALMLVCCERDIEIEEYRLKQWQHIGFPLRVDGETPSSWKLQLKQSYSNGITVDAQVKKPGAVDWTFPADVWYICGTIYVI